MGKMGALAPSGNVVKCFCALVVTAKCLADELFIHYFHRLPSASVGKAPRLPPGLRPWTPLRDRPLICQPVEKILQAPMAVSYGVKSISVS